MTNEPMPAIDVVHPDDVTHLAAHRGPALSVFIPTARHGPDTQQGPTRLRNLVRSLTDDAEAAFGEDVAAQLLAPVLALADDDDVWQHQADGLAIFATPTEQRRFRLPITFAEDAVVGERFRLRPIVGYLAAEDVFYILALAQGSLRLFEATSQGIDELPTDQLPESIADALRLEDPERQLQSRSVGGGDAMFHGHGAGEELDKEALARYFQAVDRGLVELLGATTLPVVLACVDYYLPIYREVTKLANVVEVAVSGNPEHRSPAELHSAALSLIEPMAQQRAADVADRYSEVAGTGLTLNDVTAITTAASEGRVDTLLIAADAMSSDPSTLAAIDEAIADAIGTGATITIAQASLIDSSLAAILRY